jgi:Putative prokaryotic signal transducing protein
MTEKSELVCVRSCQGWDLAQIYKSKLEAVGIPVLLKYEAAGLVFGITVDGLGQVRIMVPETCAAEAEALLEDVEAPFSPGDTQEPLPPENPEEPPADESSEHD